jgi:hypothetical protein
MGASSAKSAAKALIDLIGFYVCFAIVMYFLSPSEWEREKLH